MGRRIGESLPPLRNRKRRVEYPVNWDEFELGGDHRHLRVLSSVSDPDSIRAEMATVGSF